MKAVNYESFMKKRKRTVEFLAVFLAVLTLVTALQSTWIVSYAEDTHNDVGSYLATSGANDWQIVGDGKYSGNTADKKTPSSDGSVRVQKNVIPTDTENEFLVYLSIDTKEAFSEYFQKATYQATTSNNNKNNVGKIVTKMTGNEGVTVSTSTLGSGNSASFTVKDSQGNIIQENLKLYWSQANNVTFYLKISDKEYLIVGGGVSKDIINTVQTVQLSEDSEKVILQKVMESKQLDKVEDKMGDYIDFISVESGDYESVNYNGEKLIWKPSLKANPERQQIDTTVNGTKTKVYWNLNVSELVYKVKLNVSKDGFKSCANNMNSGIEDAESYKVNESAVLTYDGGKTVEFPVPYVRGLLYEFQFTKVDVADDSKTLAGAKFSLTSGGKTYTSIEKDNGVYTFEGIPIGEYSLTETKAPTGYMLAQQSYLVNIAGYTSESNNYERNPNSVYYRLKGDWENKKIKNNPEPTTNVTITKKVTGEGSDITKLFSFEWQTEPGTNANHDITSGDSFSLKHNESKTLSNLYVGDTLKLKETSDNDYTISIDGYSARNDGYFYIPIIEDLNITVTNTKKQPQNATIKVTKEVTGNMGDKNKEFEFTVTLQKDNQPCVLDGITNDNGEIKFKLKDGKSNEITNIPIGTKVIIAEEKGNYDLSYTIGDNTTKAEGNSYTLNALTKDGLDITFTNKLEVPIITGITLDNAPYVITVFSAVSLLAIMALKRRRHMEK